MCYSQQGMSINCLKRWFIKKTDSKLFYVHFRDELQHAGDLGKQKIKCGPIRTPEINGIRLLDELHINSKKVINRKSMKQSPRASLSKVHFKPQQVSPYHLLLLYWKEALRKNLLFLVIFPVFGNESADV